MQIELQARALKATVMLDPAAIAGIEVPNELAKVTLRISVPGRILIAEVNAKSLRRAVSATVTAGPDNVSLIVQGRLEAGYILTEAGIVAQPKAPKAAVTAEAAVSGN